MHQSHLAPNTPNTPTATIFKVGGEKSLGILADAGVKFPGYENFGENKGKPKTHQQRLTDLAGNNMDKER